MLTGHCSWGASLLCAPLGQLRSKAVYFLQNPVSVFFNWALVGRERRGFGSNKVAMHEQEGGVGVGWGSIRGGGGLEPLTPQAAFGNLGFVF